MSASGQKHDYHLVDPSPWPLATSIATLVTAVGSVYYFHSKVMWAMVLGFLLIIYCAKEFLSEINKEYFLKGSLTGFLAITIPGWTFIYALKSISSGLQSIFISTIPMFTVFWVFLVYKEEKITRLKVISVFILSLIHI